MSTCSRQSTAQPAVRTLRKRGGTKTTNGTASSMQNISPTDTVPIQSGALCAYQLAHVGMGCVS